MTRTGASAGDPVNELYDHGADLVEAAAALRAGAAAPGGARAVPAIAGCVEVALRELTAATAALERTVTAKLEDDHGARAARMRHGFTNLEVALHDAAEAAAAARGLAARALEHAPED